MMYCSKCGSDLRGNDRFCPSCGYSVKQMKIDSAAAPRNPPPARDRTTPLGRSWKDDEPIIPGYGEDGLRTKREEPDKKPKGIVFGKFKDEEEEGSGQ